MISKFDDVVVLSGGYELYHGPPSELPAYLGVLGFRQPGFTDIGDFAAQFATSPSLAADLVADAARAECSTSFAGVVSTSVPELAALWRHSSAGKAIAGGATPANTARPDSRVLTGIDAATSTINASRPAPGNWDAVGVRLAFPAAQRQWGVGAAWGLATLFALLGRQQRLLWRNPEIVGAKIGQSIFMGFVIGSLYYAPAQEAFTLRVGVALFTSALISYSSLSEVPVVSRVPQRVKDRWGGRYESVCASITSPHALSSFVGLPLDETRAAPAVSGHVLVARVRPVGVSLEHPATGKEARLTCHLRRADATLMSSSCTLINTLLRPLLSL